MQTIFAFVSVITNNLKIEVELLLIVGQIFLAKEK